MGNSTLGTARRSVLQELWEARAPIRPITRHRPPRSHLRTPDRRKASNYSSTWAIWKPLIGISLGPH